MNYSSLRGLQQFRENVGIKFQLYNSLFTSLPFHRIEKTGILLSLLLSSCEEGYKRNQGPQQIIDDFFQRHTTYTTENEKIDLLFRFVQYNERQVVLFDALEDSAFGEVNDLDGAGTLKQLGSDIEESHKQKELAEKLRDFSIRLVLTAHPTQFYPGSVLGIITDLAKALAQNDTGLINMYLQQLGRTPFFKKQKPTPYDEAMSLIWYLENVFYPAAGRILSYLKKQFPEAVAGNNPVIRMGFWPGGDKDGNPFVTPDITLQVAEALRSSIIKCYYLEVRRIKRRLTFEGIEAPLAELEKKLYNNVFIPGQRTVLTSEEIMETLQQIRHTLVYEHNGLFSHLIEQLINKVEIFGLHFASLDIRQDSSVHTQVIESLAAQGIGIPPDYKDQPEEIKKEILVSKINKVDWKSLSAIEKDQLETIEAMRTIQQLNGETGCNRYIISHCTSELNVLEVYALFLLNGWKKEEINIDIIPLFETIDDLKHAAGVMSELYANKGYREHLERRKNRQTIMLGFSDGTKDGGYLMANWSIYKAKEALTRISREAGINVIFFDGRGGPPARGGGKTHKFYASMGANISNEEIQLTVQGQTVSSNFGTIDSARFNMEQLLHAGISNDIFSKKELTLKPEQEELFQQMAELGFKAYRELKEQPYLLDYLSQISPLRFYSETNIGSRPAKRGQSSKLKLDDLRAIPFVASWSQIKQNVTGYYGVGTALKALDQQGKFNDVRKLYGESVFFKTLLDNCEMSMLKCFFPLTNFLSTHPRYGKIRAMMLEEYELTRAYLTRLSGRNELMSDYPVEQLSIQMRERIVLPLLTIQQYAITKVREMEEGLVDPPLKKIYGKLAMRCSFGIINANRNSA